MRARNLKPGFFKNEILCELDPLARILFSGLWCMADREGRLEYRPKRIKVEILPYDNCNIEKLLLQLSKDFITIYEVGGEKYIQINKFKEHQNPHIKEAASSIPAPYKHSTSMVQEPDEHGSRPADSLNPITDSLNPIPPMSPKGSDSDFEKIYQAYPKHVGKKPALKAWLKLNGTRPAIETILSAINTQRQTEEWRKENGKYIPHLATWLNQARWEDEIEQPKPKSVFS